MAKLLAEWFWIDRWMGSSGFLLPIEPRGLYREMLTQAWRRECRLPLEHEAIRRAIGCTLPEWNRCWLKVEKYWRVDGDALVNDTQLEVYAEALAKQKIAEERGRRGGLASAQARSQVQPKQNSSSTQVQLESKPLSLSPIVCSEDLEHTPRARVNGESPERNALALRAGAFITRYKDMHLRFRQGARYVGKIHFDYQEAMRLVEVYEDARLDKLAEVWLKTDHDFAENGTRTIAKFRSMATWCDERLRKAGL